MVLLLTVCAMTAYAQTSQRELPDSVLLGYGIETDVRTSPFTIAGVNADAFTYASAADVSKALYGKIAGLNVYQGSGSSADNK